MGIGSRFRLMASHERAGEPVRTPKGPDRPKKQAQLT
jgi:hypothetical protein